ncbi:MAG: TolC family protein [Gemmatimonadota bacterium]|nr:TolC family protein [Gemmatimonadota bacterium]
MPNAEARTLLGLVLGSLLLFPVAVHGQGTVRRVSLTEALEEFAENSLALKIARSETAQLAGAARQARAYTNPAFSFGRDDLGHLDEEYWEQTFLFAQPVEWPGRTAARARAATYATGAGTARLLADSIALAYEVREAYVQAWLAEEAERIARRTASVIQTVAEDAEIRLDAGDISAFEARRLRLERVQADQQVAEAALQSRDARRKLATLIAPGTGTEEVGPSEGMDGVPPMVTRGAALQALPRRPDLEAAARELDAARAGEEIAATYAIPEPTVGLGYRHHLDGLGGASIAVDLPLPLFDRGSAARAEAAAQSSAAAYRLDLRRQLARNDLASAADRYASRRARLEAVSASLLADGEALLSAATAAYSEQEMSLLELLDAASAFQNALSSALSLRSEAWIAYYDVLRATGGGLEDER